MIDGGYVFTKYYGIFTEFLTKQRRAWSASALVVS